MDEIRFVGDLTRVDVKPGDVFVLQCDRRLSFDQSKHIRDFLSAKLGGAEVIVMDEGMKLGAISKPAE